MSAASLGAAMRDLHDDVAALLSSFRDAASMHAWAAESPRAALSELCARFANARNVKKREKKNSFFFTVFLFFFFQAASHFSSATRDAEHNVYVRLVRLVRDRQRFVQQSNVISDALSVAINALNGASGHRPAAPLAESSKASLLSLLKTLAGSLDIDLSDGGAGVDSLAIGGKAVMLEVALVDDAALRFVQKVDLQYINPRDSSLFSSPAENDALLALLRAGNRLALARWFARLRQYNDWASQFNVDVRKLLAVFEADFETLARSVHNAEHANSGLGRLAPGGPTGVRSIYYEPVLYDDEEHAAAARSLFFVMELVADGAPLALPLAPQLSGGAAAVLDLDSALVGAELVGDTVAESRLRYVAHLSQPLAITVRALSGLLAQAQVGAEVASVGGGSLPTALQLLYTQATSAPAPTTSTVFETTIGARRQRFSVNFGSGDAAVLVQRVPLAHVRDVNALVGTLRQQHIVHEILASLFLVATPESDGARTLADGFELSLLPPDRILVHLSVGDANSAKLAAMVITVRRDQRITCELSGISEAAARPIAEYAERLLAAARSLPHTLARIAPLLGDAGGGDALSDVAQARLARLAGGGAATAPPTTSATTSQRAKRTSEQINGGEAVQSGTKRSQR
jgi:hypothetical protein